MKRALILSLSLILVVTAGFAVEPKPYDSFSAPNYRYLDTAVADAQNIPAELEKAVSGNVSLLYVSGCENDKDALPAFQAMTAKYPEATFVRVGQYSTARQYILEHYGTSGAPALMMLYKGNVVSNVEYYFDTVNGVSTFMGWDASVRRWIDQMYPAARQINSIPNLFAVSSFNYRDVLRGKRAVMLRVNNYDPNIANAVSAIAAMARKFPAVTFALDMGYSQYNQEFSFKYQDALNGFSIVENVDLVVSNYRKKYNDPGYDLAALTQWIAAKDSYQYAPQQAAANVTPAYLKGLYTARSHAGISVLSPQEYSGANANGAVTASLPEQTLFYTALNGALDSRRNVQTALLLLDEMAFPYKGGVDKAIPAKLLRDNVYLPVLKRALRYEQNSEVQQGLKRLVQTYGGTLAADSTGAGTGGAGGTTSGTTGGPVAVSPKLPFGLNAGVTDASFCNELERAILVEMNLARTNPKEYAKIIEEYRGFIKGNNYQRPGEALFKMKEGVSAVNEAIAALKRQRPLPALTLSRGLSAAARDHAKDLVKTVRTGHDGSDKSTPMMRMNRYGTWKKASGENISYGSRTARDIVVWLIVDDGIKSRVHRKTIFHNLYRVVGVSINEAHPSYGIISVQDFAAEYREK